MVLYDNDNKCCGCSACEQICPQNAIEMVANNKGFLYPHINENLCVNCKICKTVCPYKNATDTENNISSAYVFQHNFEKVLKESSSGGFFTAISDYVLNNGGVVFGSVMDEFSFDVHHICAETQADRDKMRGSKYVQSNTQEIFTKVKCAINNGKTVLFTGTPCQNVALLNFLGEKPNNLITVDLLCHGVASNKLLKEYLESLQKKYNNNIKLFNYRTKKYSYSAVYAQSCELIMKNNKRKNPINLKTILDVYTLNMRESCYGCDFSSYHRYGDFTIGDFWEKSTVKKNENGYSIVFVNSKKGKQIINELSVFHFLFEIDSSVIHSSSLNGGVKRKDRVDGFWDCYFKNGLNYALKEYSNYCFLTTIKRICARICFYLKIDKLFIK